MSSNDSSIALISVISSGVIAFSSIVFPIIINLINDATKWKREKKAIESSVINNSTDALLKMVAAFRSGNVEFSTRDTSEKAISDIINSFYLWERSVWGRLHEAERIIVKELRNKFESGNYKIFEENGPDFANKILEITFMVMNRI